MLKAPLGEVVIGLPLKSREMQDSDGDEKCKAPIGTAVILLLLNQRVTDDAKGKLKVARGNGRGLIATEI